MNGPIAIIGMACRYPDADSPAALWENALAQRRAFRLLPAERLAVADYYSPDRKAQDRTYSMEAALIEGYEFDRVKFKVAGSTFRSADLAHWLALDLAAQALADAGFTGGHGLPRETTGVLLGNTLTGEFSRASLMRYRWPYVRRTLEAELEQEGWAREKRQAFLASLEDRYKAPFPPVGEESLAGGLSNTIAGRICNHFDLKGGGYTVDGACASSLLAITTACTSLVDGDLDVALAGGVDLSLDPFEIVGFAKAGALAGGEEMRIYDLRSDGFWPGEGCGFVVLMRYDEAIAQGRRVYATIRGWGISSDGSGGITRPEEEGQLLALRRAYRRAGFGIETIGYFEGHGTGTRVGDATELRALSRARGEGLSRMIPPQPGRPSPATIGSIKANIGHTKAAAGIAGLIKATMAIHTQVLPPTTGCEEPRPEAIGDLSALHASRQAELWPAEMPLRAGVNSMGFGGINTHLVLEGVVSERRTQFTPRELSLSRSAQDAELFLLGGKNIGDLRRQMLRLLTYAHGLSRAELTDLAVELRDRLDEEEVRAAVVASRPAELGHRLKTALAWIDQGTNKKLDFSSGTFLGEGRALTRLGFLFPGQGSPAHLDGGIYRRRFATVADLYTTRDFSAGADGVATAVAQPALVTASLGGLRLLNELGLQAAIAVGHSLGELTAFHWAGALTEESLLRIAAARGKAMAELGSPTGAMAGIEADQEQVQALLNGELVVIAGLNSPKQTVISGPAKEVTAVMDRAVKTGLRATKLLVSHAFHSALVGAATPALARQLARETFGPLQHPVASTVTGSILRGQEDLRQLLCRQVTHPVRFIEAVSAACQFPPPSNLTSNLPLPGFGRGVDFWVEVGPGRALNGLMAEIGDTPVLSLDSGGPSLRGLLQAAGAAFALGAPLRLAPLFDGRFARPFHLDWRPRFFVNPCEANARMDAPAPGAQTGTSPYPGADLSAFEFSQSESGPSIFLPLFDESGGEGRGEEGLKSSQQPLPQPRRENEKIPNAPAGALNPTPQGGHSPHPGDILPSFPSALELVRHLVAERAELPPSEVRDHSRLLSDLHLNSITVGQLVAEAVRRLGLPPLVSVTEFANASVGKVADALEEMARTGAGPRAGQQQNEPAGVDSWIRPFTMEWIERPLRRAPLEPKRSALANKLPMATRANWRIIAPGGHPLALRLQEVLTRAGGSGVVVCLPAEDLSTHISECRPGGAVEDTVVRLLLEGARAVQDLTEDPRFVLVQAACTAGGFPRSFHLEMPALTTCVVSVPFDHPQAAEWICNEAHTALGYAEARYDADGVRYEPHLKLLSLDGEAVKRLPLDSKDVLLVTGGGKGIAAECALALARNSGARVALLGRSSPGSDAELAANLERFDAAGISWGYFAADVVDPGQVRQALAAAEGELGPITALLHGAGRNVPQLVSALDEAAFQRTLAPKVRGLRHILAAVKPDQLRILITFGSIIARSGLPGEADYAVANEWLTALTERFQKDHPHCRCLAVEWSIWSGVGMGQRLGRVEALSQQGITPIPPDQGVGLLLRLLNGPLPSTSVVVTGRFGNTPTLRMAKPELPFFRFLEHPKVFYPGVELVVDAELSADSDPYLDDHVYRGERIFPAVMGLEAMAQTAMALAGSSVAPSFEKVRFNRPVIAPRHRKTVIRLAAVQQEPGRVDVALRSDETGFQADHFTAVCRFAEAESAPEPADPPKPELEIPDLQSPRLPLEPVRELYSDLLFHTGRFQRLQGYRNLRAKECIAEIDRDGLASWFGRYLPPDFLLGDPGIRDAAIHAIQACIPHARVLPVGVERIRPGPSGGLSNRSGKENRGSALFVQAREQLHDAETFTYNLEVLAPDGGLLESWEGLRLRLVERLPRRTPWPEPLLGPYLERRLGELVPGAGVGVTVQRFPTNNRPAQTDHALSRILGHDALVRRRPDGKPEVDAIRAVSVAHAGELTLAVAGAEPLGCDVEPVAARPGQVWQELLGPDRFRLAETISREANENLDRAATRVWVAAESLKKAGLPLDAPLVLGAVQEDHWVLLGSGLRIIATLITNVRGADASLAIGVLTAS